MAKVSSLDMDHDSKWKPKINWTMAKVNNAWNDTSYGTIPHLMIKTFAYDAPDHPDDIDGLFWSNSCM